MPFYLKNRLERTSASGITADIYATAAPLFLISINVHAVVLLTLDREGYEHFYTRVLQMKLLWCAGFAIAFFVCRRGVGWLQAQISEDAEALKTWNRRGLAALLIWSFGTVVSIAAAIYVFKTRNSG
jgi:hypothetical protein